jgi:hypothetical protein
VKRVLDADLHTGKITKTEYDLLISLQKDSIPLDDAVDLLLSESSFDAGRLIHLASSIYPLEDIKNLAYMIAVKTACHQTQESVVIRPTYIYFVENTDTNKIKIGRTVNINARLRALTTQSGTDLVVLACLQADPSTEQLLHSCFSDGRGIGEWFDSAYIIEKLPFLRVECNREQMLDDFVTGYRTKYPRLQLVL